MADGKSLLRIAASSIVVDGDTLREQPAARSERRRERIRYREIDVDPRL